MKPGFNDSHLFPPSIVFFVWRKMMTATAKPSDILLERFGARLAVKISSVRPLWPGSGVGGDEIRLEERGVAPEEIEVIAVESAWLSAEPGTVAQDDPAVLV
jgi:hypothetical protein